MTSTNDTLVMLDDPLDTFANDDDVVVQNHHIIGSNSCSNISSVSSNHSQVRVDMDDVVDEDNIKPPYPEDTVDDEGQLVDEHDDHHHQDDLVIPTTLKNEMHIATVALPKISTDAANVVKNSVALPSSPKQRRKRDATIMRKAPQAPKRFKSSYICFFTSKQTEIKGILGDKATVMEISKKSAQMWKELGSEERAYWEEVASKDKERYMMEKATYCGPWQVPYKRARKDPTAPKRPMSAFLLFSQGRRGKVKEKNPGIKNTEVSRILGEQWRNCTEEDRQPFLVEEKSLRETYKVALSEWKAKEEERKEVEMNRHKEQLEWQKQQRQQGLQHAQQYAQQQQQHSTIHPQMHPYPQQVFMPPSNPPHAYSEFQPNWHPSQYVFYPTPVYQYAAAGKQQPVILGPNGAPLYSPQLPPQLQHPQHSPLPSSPAHPAQLNYHHSLPTNTKAFDESSAGSLLPDSDYPDLDQLVREPQTAD